MLIKKETPDSSAQEEAEGRLYLESSRYKVCYHLLREFLIVIVFIAFLFFIGQGKVPHHERWLRDILVYCSFASIALALLWFLSRLPGHVLLLCGDRLFLSFDSKRVFGRTMGRQGPFLIPQDFSVEWAVITDVRHEVEKNEFNGWRQGTLFFGSLQGNLLTLSDRLSDQDSDRVSKELGALIRSEHPKVLLTGI